MAIEFDRWKKNIILVKTDLFFAERCLTEFQLLSCRNPIKSKQLSSGSEEEPQDSPSPFKTPEPKPRKQLATTPRNKQVQIQSSFDVTVSVYD